MPQGVRIASTPCLQRSVPHIPPGGLIDAVQQNRIADFIWNIADDVLRDVYVRGKYWDVILPMTVVRRLDSVPEPVKVHVLKPQNLLEEDLSEVAAS